MHVRKLLLTFALICSMTLADDEHWCNGTALESLTASLDGFLLGTEPSSWLYNHLWGSSECPCSWYGVDCSSSSSIALSLPNNKIYGTISSSFCSDIYSTINLDNNELFQKLPSCFGGMSHLQNLKLRNNSFQGLLPESLGNLNKITELDISNNSFSGPFPRYFSCPNEYFKSKANLVFHDNLFWCPTADWCQEDGGECETCTNEPSENCKNLNAIACDALIGCCYESSWGEQCDDIVSNTSADCTPDKEEEPCATHSDSDDSFDYSGILWTIFSITAILAILAIGCAVGFFVSWKKRNWSFNQVKRTMIQVSEDFRTDPDDDIYQDEHPPRSSLDYEL